MENLEQSFEKWILHFATPGEWTVRRVFNPDGSLRDCFVTAPDVLGYAYDAQILGDDEYRDFDDADESGITRLAADCELIVRAVKEYREKYKL